MKSLILLSILTVSIFTTTSFAGSAPMIRLDNFSKNVVSIEVNAEGVAKIDLLDKKDKIITLKQVTIDKVESLVAALADVKVVSTHSLYVCKMMSLSPYIPTLSVVDASGALRKVYMQTNCTHSDKLYPAQPNDAAQAQVGVEVLKILSAELGKVELYTGF